MIRRLGHYILNGHEPVEIDDLLAWGEWFETADRHVARDELAPGVIVSTVFLGLDHQFGNGPPILFETMVFDDYERGDGERYSTWDEAETGHAAWVAMIRARLKPVTMPCE
jgi:hypothetical protein